MFSLDERLQVGECGRSAVGDRVDMVLLEFEPFPATTPTPLTHELRRRPQLQRSPQRGADMPPEMLDRVDPDPVMQNRLDERVTLHRVFHEIHRDRTAVDDM